jgi:hypothetical protein
MPSLSNIDLDVRSFSLNGDYGSFFDGARVVCTIDKSVYQVAFSFLAQISKSDFGIFYCVVPLDTGGSATVISDKHSGANDRSYVYFLPAVYVMPESESPANGG